MQPCIRRRLLLALVTLVGVSWLMFGILWLIPGDVAIAILGEGATAERIAVLREQMGLKRSFDNVAFRPAPFGNSVRTACTRGRFRERRRFAE